MNQLRWRDYLQNPNPLATALLTKMQVAPRERLAVKAACLAHLLGLPISAKRRRIIGQFLDVYLPLQPEEAIQLEERLAEINGTDQEETMEGIVTSWEVRGAMKMVRDLLDKRFGPLDVAIKDQIALYPHELLTTLNLAQLDFTSLADLEVWLAANPAPPWVDPLGEYDEDEETADGD